MDPLSEMLSLLKLQNYVSGGFVVSAEAGFEFPKHPGYQVLRRSVRILLVVVRGS